MPQGDSWLVGGYYQQTSLLSYLTVPKSGHFVPNNYYAASFAFFSDYIDMAADPTKAPGLTCKKPEGCSVATSQCGYMNNCFESYGLGTC